VRGGPSRHLDANRESHRCKRVTAFVGDIASFVIITGIVFLNVTLDFVQEHRGGNAAERLRARSRCTRQRCVTTRRAKCRPMRAFPKRATSSLLPYASLLGFQPLPAAYYATIAGIVLTYLATAEVAKRYFYGSVEARRAAGR